MGGLSNPTCYELRLSWLKLGAFRPSNSARSAGGVDSTINRFNYYSSIKIQTNSNLPIKVSGFRIFESLDANTQTEIPLDLSDEEEA